MFPRAKKRTQLEPHNVLGVLFCCDATMLDTTRAEIVSRGGSTLPSSKPMAERRLSVVNVLPHRG